MKIRIFALLMALLMMLSMVVSCKKKGGTDTTETNTRVELPTEENEITPDIPAKNYDRTINVLQRSGAWKEEWDPELENTDVLSDAIYTRNVYLSDK